MFINVWKSINSDNPYGLAACYPHSINNRPNGTDTFYKQYQYRVRMDIPRSPFTRRGDISQSYLLYRLFCLEPGPPLQEFHT